MENRKERVFYFCDLTFGQPTVGPFKPGREYGFYHQRLDLEGQIGRFKICNLDGSMVPTVVDKLNHNIRRGLVAAQILEIYPQPLARRPIEEFINALPLAQVASK